MKLGRLITHYGGHVASISPYREEGGKFLAMLSCSDGDTSVNIGLDTAELRATAASLLDLADEIDGYNEAPTQEATEKDPLREWRCTWTTADEGRCVLRADHAGEIGHRFEARP